MFVCGISDEDDKDSEDRPLNTYIQTSNGSEMFGSRNPSNAVISTIKQRRGQACFLRTACPEKDDVECRS